MAGMIGTVVGFLLLDQRDDQTMAAPLVTPLSLGDYLSYRMIVLLVRPARRFSRILSRAADCPRHWALTLRG